MPNNQKKAERAKLFMPFDSLKGFRQYLLEKEKVVVSQKQLSDDACEDLNRQLAQIHLGDIVRIVHYHQGQYIETTGMVSKLDLEIHKFIQIVNTRISFQHMIEVQKVSTHNEDYKNHTYLDT